MSGEKPGDLEFRIILPDENIRMLRGRGDLQYAADNTPVRMVGTVQDITERKGAEQALRQSEEQLRALAAHLQSVREEERTWIAREIHDHFGQALTGLKMDIAWLERRLPEDQTVLRDKTQAMAGLIDTTTQSVRQLSAALRPGVLDDLGLLAALDWQAGDFQSRTGIRCEFVSALEEDPVGQEQATQLFRIVQEALTNVARHAEATHVTIRLEEEAGRFVLLVQDDGKGITGEEIASTRGLGVVGIRERALLLGGEVTFTGVPGQGTTVTVKVPRHQGEAGGA